MLGRIFFINLLLFLLSTPCGAVEILFHPKAEVTNKYVTLGDLVTFNEKSGFTDALATKIVAKSPQPGDNLYLSTVEIRKHIVRKNQIPSATVWSGPKVIQVMRKGQEILPDNLTASIDAYIQKHSRKYPQAKITFIPRSLPLPFMLPLGKLDIEVIPSNPALFKSNRFSLLLRVDGKVRKNLSIQGKLEILSKVVVTATPIRKGEILTPENTTMAVRNISNYRNPCTSMRNVLGKRLRLTVREAQVISITDVEFPPLVKKGQLVKVLYSNGNLHLSATGIAKADGKLNQIIRVQNASSNKIIHCRVSAPGIVEVKI